MPWCDTCSRFYNPNSLQADGRCPTCGRVVAEPTAEAEVPATETVPWHFKLLVAATVIYLGWRLLQGIGWVANAL